jgi:hypothetical protein
VSEDVERVRRAHLNDIGQFHLQTVICKSFYLHEIILFKIVIV